MTTEQEHFGLPVNDPPDGRPLHLVIKHYKSINNTPALPLALSAWYELARDGMCENTIKIQWDHQALVAFNEYPGHAPNPVGVITYTHADWLKQYHINLGWVHFMERGFGVYSALWKELISRAKADNVYSIESGTRMHNTNMRKVAAAHGRTESGVYLSYPVPPNTEL